MYQVTVTNNSKFGIGFVGGNQVIPQGDTWKSDAKLGNLALEVWTRGVLSFQDIGDKHIPGDSGETWGVLIAYQGEEFVGRYEGGGQLTVVVNEYNQAILGGMDLRQVSLPAMQLAGATPAAG